MTPIDTKLATRVQARLSETAAEATDVIPFIRDRLKINEAATTELIEAVDAAAKAAGFKFKPQLSTPKGGSVKLIWIAPGYKGCDAFKTLPWINNPKFGRMKGAFGPPFGKIGDHLQWDMDCQPVERKSPSDPRLSKVYLILWGYNADDNSIIKIK